MYDTSTIALSSSGVSNFVVRVVFNHWFSMLMLWQTFKSDVLELQAKKDSLSQELADMNQKLEENKHQLKQDEIA